MVLKEISNAGHYDSIAAFFTMLAIYLWIKRKEASAVSVLALATLTKFFSGVLLPILITKKRIQFFSIFAFVSLALYLPYFFWGQAGGSQVFEGLMTYHEEWSYNSSIFAMIVSVLGLFLPDSFTVSKLIVGVMYLGFWAWLIVKPFNSDKDLLEKCFLAIGGLFLLSPVGDPWYYCWVVPFLCFFPYKSWRLLSGLLILSYFEFSQRFRCCT